MKPTHWFTLACFFFGSAIACIEAGVKAYVNDDRWDKALAEQTEKAKDASEHTG